MKIFLYKTAIFIGFCVLIISLTFYLSTTLIKNKAKFLIDLPVKNAVFGHSHPECAYNDTLIHDFKNFAQSRQSYFYSFVKIKNVISQNKSIKNVFIEFTNNQIHKNKDNWIWDDSAISNRLPNYLPFLDKGQINLLYTKNSKSFVAGASKSFRYNLTNLLLFKYDYSAKIGGYRWLDHTMKDSSIVGLEKTQSTTSDKKHSELSHENIKYLEKIVKYCKDHNINIYLIRSPQHKYCPDRNNEKIFIEIKNTKFKEVEFLDFNDFPLKNNEFADLSHLNIKGAKNFSIWFDEIIGKGLLSMDNKSDFIHSEINKLDSTTNN